MSATELRTASGEPLGPLLVVSASMLLVASLTWGQVSAVGRPAAGSSALEWWMLVIPTALGGLELRVRTRRSTIFVTFLELPLVVGLFSCSGRGLLVAHVMGSFIALLALRYRPPLLVYNLTGFALDCCLAVLLFHAIGGDATPLSPAGWTAALAASAVFAVVGSIRAGLLALLRGGVPLAQWVHELGTCLGVAGINATLAVVALGLVHHDARAVWPIAALGVVVGVAYRAFVELLADHEGLDRLYEASSSIDLVTTERDSLDELLSQAVELLGAEAAELVVDGDDRPRRRGRRTPTTESSSRVLVAALGGADRRLGELRVAAYPGAAFSENDRRLLEMFANHAGTAVRNAQLVNRLRAEVARRRHEALHDALTGLPNRTLFDQRVRSAVATSTNGAVVGVVLVDLDRFKEVNDTLGHDQGDAFLVELARRLERAAVTLGHDVARLGGDEFAVLVPAPTTEGVLARAAGLKAIIEAPVDLGSIRVDVVASVGVAVLPTGPSLPVSDPPPGADAATTLLRRADVAMYVAKRRHLGLVSYRRDHDPYDPGRLSLAADLRSAVDEGHVDASFQPEVDLRSGRIVSFEVLARWSHPLHGLIGPAEFVPIAERSGLIRDLTQLVLRQALRQLRIWRDDGHDVTVAVNLSVRCLTDDRLVDVVADALGDAGLPPSALTLEVTEGTIMSDPEHAAAMLHRLRASGVRLSIDDFGMGYSSLAQLRRMPVSQLKIDRAFVSSVHTDDADAAIVRSVVDLGHNLGLEVVAEGVEHPATARRLVELGCDTAQGYLIGRPMSGEECTRWLAARRAAR